MQRQIASHPMDALEDDVPVTVGMLRDSLDDAGQAVGFVLSAALFEAGLSGTQCRGIAQALHTMTAKGVFTGPAQDVIAGITYGVTLHLEGKPIEVGRR